MASSNFSYVHNKHRVYILGKMGIKITKDETSSLISNYLGRYSSGENKGISKLFCIGQSVLNRIQKRTPMVT